MEMIFGGSGMTKEAYDWILENIPLGSTILEFGSGHVSTQYLSEKYNLISVEHKLEFVGLYKSKYIYAPLDDDGWYDMKELLTISKDYSMIIIDGPSVREKFLDYLDVFNTSVPIMVDDIYREREMKLITNLSEKLGRKFGNFEQFGIIYK